MFRMGFAPWDVEVSEQSAKVLSRRPLAPTPSLDRPPAHEAPTHAMIHDRDPFTPDRLLLNPKFESYKLQPASASATSLYALPSPGLHLRPLRDHARLSYAEVQGRVRHNHLSAGRAGEVVYINGELEVVAIQLDEVRFLGSSAAEGEMG